MPKPPRMISAEKRFLIDFQSGTICIASAATNIVP